MEQAEKRQQGRVKGDGEDKINAADCIFNRAITEQRLYAWHDEIIVGTIEKRNKREKTGTRTCVHTALAAHSTHDEIS